VVSCWRPKLSARPPVIEPVSTFPGTKFPMRRRTAKVFCCLGDRTRGPNGSKKGRIARDKCTPSVHDVDPYRLGVEMIWTKLVTPQPVIEPVSDERGPERNLSSAEATRRNRLVGNRTSSRHNCAGLRLKMCPRIRFHRIESRRYSDTSAGSPLVSRSYRRIRRISTRTL
jgi:hypothetical protein